MDFPCKVESGLQLLARLGVRRCVRGLYPTLFGDGPQHGQVVELSGEIGTPVYLVLCDILAATLLPESLGGKASAAALLLTDGHFHIRQLADAMRRRVTHLDKPNYNMEVTIEACLSKFHIFRAHDTPEMLISFQALERLLSSHADISVVAVDTISAFYWSDRMFGYGTLRMDAYVKKMLKFLQKMTKEHKPVLFYTRPSYFVSQVSSGEDCVEEPTMERINYRISFRASSAVMDKDNAVEVNIDNFHATLRKVLFLDETGIKWNDLSI